jgi:hypothetical protein
VSELSQSIQQAYEGSGREGARQVFLEMAEQQEWTEAEIKEAVLLLRGMPRGA